MILPVWVYGVGGSLAVYAVGPETNEEKVSEEREDRPEDVEDEHCELGQVYEHAQHADDKVELGNTGRRKLLFSSSASTTSYNELHTSGILTGW